jgi:hypothetical protein
MGKELGMKSHTDHEEPLSREYGLLKAIFVSVIPHVFLEMPKKPLTNICKLATIIVVLSYLTFGYCSPYIFLRKKKELIPIIFNVAPKHEQ